jgi:hypothetical protein
VLQPPPQQPQQEEEGQQQQEEDEEGEEQGVLAPPPQPQGAHQQGGFTLTRTLIDGVHILLREDGHTATWCVERVIDCFSAVLEVYRAAEMCGLLGVVLLESGEDAPTITTLLLKAVHSRWLSGMPWLQQKWRVTDRLQRLILGQQAQQVQQHPPGARAEASSAAAAAEERPLAVSGDGHQGGDVCVRLWTEAEAAAHAGQWSLFVQRLEQLTGLRPAWATYPLADFAQRQGRGAEGVAGLCAALLQAWREAAQQSAAEVAQEMRDTVLAAVQARGQQWAALGIYTTSR